LSDNPHIDLGMPGMNMGPNRVLMKRVEPNTSRVEPNTSRVETNTSRVETTYEGQGVIVKCPSGRRTWKATVSLPDAGVMDFVFDVLY
jgi:hypothetical protein